MRHARLREGYSRHSQVQVQAFRMSGLPTYLCRLCQEKSALVSELVMDAPAVVTDAARPELGQFLRATRAYAPGVPWLTTDKCLEKKEQLQVGFTRLLSKGEAYLELPRTWSSLSRRCCVCRGCAASAPRLSRQRRRCERTGCRLLQDPGRQGHRPPQAKLFVPPESTSPALRRLRAATVKEATVMQLLES